MAEMDLKVWADKLKTLEDRGLDGACKKIVHKYALILKSDAQRNVSVRSGALRQSIRSSEGYDDGPEIVLEAGGGTTKVRHAGLQEYGGTVTPKNSRYLTIPFGAALTAAGALKAQFRNVGSLRNVKGLFLINRKDGKLFLGWKEGKALRMGFFLTKGPITIPAREFLRGAIRTNADRFKADVQNVIAEGLKGGDVSG